VTNRVGDLARAQPLGGQARAVGMAQVVMGDALDPGGLGGGVEAPPLDVPMGESAATEGGEDRAALVGRLRRGRGRMESPDRRRCGVTDFWDQDAVRSREQDEVDAWETLERAAARVNFPGGPRGIEHAAEEGLLDVRLDRSGRPRIQLDAAEEAAERLSGRAARYEDAGFARLPREENR